jgi:hypothetical protein
MYPQALKRFKSYGRYIAVGIYDKGERVALGGMQLCMAIRDASG